MEFQKSFPHLESFRVWFLVVHLKSIYCTDEYAIETYSLFWNFIAWIYIIFLCYCFTSTIVVSLPRWKFQYWIAQVGNFQISSCLYSLYLVFTVVFESLMIYDVAIVLITLTKCKYIFVIRKIKTMWSLLTGKNYASSDFWKWVVADLPQGSCTYALMHTHSTTLLAWASAKGFSETTSMVVSVFL